ncbi:tyrosine-type recombinase/integrase [Peribacillus aracenensis]|uniref:tyrosine-type recombinase/integrase n=1 Tax=Peribacillus aracenensis TaxID=2976708 RepID=UPI0021A52718|nr:tyrosine-type recombinase/integrase [Peribacillus sp. BBB004]
MLPDVVGDFLMELTNEGLKVSSVKRYSADLRQFFTWIEDNKIQSNLESIQNLSITDLAQYMDYISSLNYSDDTVRRLRVVLNRFFTYLGINMSINQIHPSGPNKRDLTETDFVTKQEMNKLLSSMQNTSYTAPGTGLETRNRLIDRNISIIYLICKYGLSPAEIHFIDMNDINFAQSVITLNKRTIHVSSEHIAVILRYFNSVPEPLRPRYRTRDPLFVAFYNSNSTYRFDYQRGMPSRLSIRSIQHIIQSEVYLAGLRRITAINLRNSCILDALKSGRSDEDVVKLFGFKNAFSLRRYKSYLYSIPQQ